MSSSSPSPPNTSHKILTTPPPRRSFPLPTSSLPYFTGDLFDRLVLFLHKHHVTFTSIECVARGVDKATALRNGPTICVYIVQDADLTKRLVRMRNRIGEDMVKKQVVAAKEVHLVNKVRNSGDNDEKNGDKMRLDGVGEISEKHAQSEQQMKKLQTEGEKISNYVEEVAGLFERYRFALDIPSEIKFIELVGVIFPEEPGRVAISGTWTNGGVMGLLTGS